MVDGKPISFTGVHNYHLNDDISGGADFPDWNDNWGRFDSVKCDAYFKYLSDNNFNFIRFQMNLAGVYYSQTYRDLLEQIATIGQRHGVYILYVVAGLNRPIQGRECFSWRNEGQPYTPYVQTWEELNTTELYNSAILMLATLCQRHSNVMIGNWNEPIDGGWAEFNIDSWNNYLSNLRYTLTLIRNSGYTGVIIIMLGVALWENEGTPRDTLLTAIEENMDLFTDYGSVALDFHYYWILMYPYHPPTYSEIPAYFDRIGVKEVMTRLKLCCFESGLITSKGMLTEQLNAQELILKYFSENGVDWTIHTGQPLDESAIYDVKLLLNDAGRIALKWARYVQQSKAIYSYGTIIL